MLVRPTSEHDTDTIADVYIASFAGLTFLPKLHTDEETRSWIRSVVVVQHEVWVAEDDGLVIGFAVLSHDMLMWMYVHPDAQNRGVGSALLDRAKLERPGGFRLWTFQRNTAARRFYERHGLLPVELTDGSGNEEKEPDALYEWAP